MALPSLLVSLAEFGGTGPVEPLQADPVRERRGKVWGREGTSGQ